MATVYIESTIPSYYTARPSRDLIIAARQQVTRDWWQTSRLVLDVCSSQLVIDEISQGDPTAAAERLEAMKGIRLLHAVPRVDELGAEYQQELQIPDDCRADAFHLGYVVHYRVEYLLTWNLTHLANPALQLKMQRYNMGNNLWTPMVVTPEQLLYKPSGGGI